MIGRSNISNACTRFALVAIMAAACSTGALAQLNKLVMNRVTGAANWNTASTWIQYRTGTATFTNGSPTVTGTGSQFLSELQPGDVLMLAGSPGTVRGTVLSIASNTQLTLTANATANAGGSYGRQRVPSSADSVVIGNSVLTTALTVTLNTTPVTVDWLSIRGMSVSNTLTFAAANALTVTNGVIVNAPSGNNLNNSIDVAAGSLTAGSLTMETSGGNTRDARVQLSTGSMTIIGDVIMRSIFARHHIDMTGAATINIGGHVNNGAGAVGGGFTTPPVTSTINLNGSSSQTVFLYGGLTSLGVVKVNNAAGVTSGEAMTLAALTIGDATSGSIFRDGGFQVTSTGTLDLVDGTFELGSVTAATTFPAFTTRNIAASSTVDYAASVAQSVSGTPTYGHVRLSGANVKTLPAATLTVQGDVTFAGTASATAAGTFVLGGGLTLGSGTAFDAAGFTHSLGGNWTNNGGTFTAGSSTVTFNGTGVQAINGLAATQSFNNIVVNKTAGQTLSVSGSTTTLNLGGTFTQTQGNFTAPTTMSVTGTTTLTAGTFTAGSSIAAGGDWTNNGGTFTAGTSTVTFNGTGAQAINGTAVAQSFNNIVVNKTAGQTLSVSGSTTTLNAGGTFTQTQGNFTAPTTMSVTGTTTLTAGTFTAGASMSAGGDWTNNGGAFTAGAGSVTFNGTGAQAINGTAAAQSFNHIVVNKTAGQTLGVGGSTTQITTSALTMTSGMFAVAPTTSVNGTLTLTGGTLAVGSSTLTLASTVLGTGTTITSNAGGTVVYAQPSSGQAVRAANYGNLTFNNFAKNLSGVSVGIAGTFTPGSSTTHDTSSSAISFNGSTAQAIPAFSYATLTMANPAGASLGGPVFVGRSLELTAGPITTGANTLTVGLNGSVSPSSGFVVGTLARTYPAGGTVSRSFPVGTSGGSYAPLTLTANSLSSGGTLSVSVADGHHPHLATSDLDGLKAVNLVWTVGNAAVAMTSYDISFAYPSGVNDSPSDAPFYSLGKYNGAWILPSYAATGTPTTTSFTRAGIPFTDGFGDYQIARPLPAGKNYQWIGGTGSWDDPSKWTPAGYPSTSGDTATIAATGTVQLGSSRTIKRLVLSGNASVLTVQSAGSLTLGGNLVMTAGRLETQAAFPLVNGSTNLSDGTVAYTGSGAQTVAALQYAALDISGDRGGQTVTFAPDTVKVTGDLTASATNVSYDLSVSTVDYNGTSHQTIASLPYHHLISSNTGSRSLSGTGVIGVSGIFIPGSNSYSSIDGSTLDFNGTGAQSLPAFQYHHLTLSGARGANHLTFPSGDTVHIAGSFTSSVTFTSGSVVVSGSTVEFNGSTSQAADGFTFDGLIIDNAAGVTFGDPASVAGALRLTDGVMSMGTDSVIIEPSAVITRSGGWVAGKMARHVGISGGPVSVAFAIGDLARYAPVTIDLPSNAVAGYLVAATTGSDHPQIANSGVNAALSANRYWSLSNAGLTPGTPLSVTLSYDPSDIDAGADPAAFVVDRWTGSAWNLPTLGTVTSTSAQTTGLTAFGEFIAGESSAGVVTSTPAGGLWSSPTTWVGGVVPGNNAKVVIATTGGDSVTMNVSTATLTNLSINSGAILSGNGTAVTVSIKGAAGTDLINNGVLNANAATVRLTGAQNWDGSGTFNLSTLDLNGKALTLSFGTPNTIWLDAAGTSIIGGGSIVPGTHAAFGFDGTAAQTIPVTAYSFNGLSIANTSSAGATPDAAITASNVTGNIRVLGGTLSNGGFAIDGQVGRTFEVASGASFVLTGSSTLPTNFTLQFANASLIHYEGSGQTIVATQYGTLDLTTGNGLIFANGTTRIAGDLIVGASAPNATANAATIEFNGTSAQSIEGMAFHTITFTGVGTKTLTGVASTIGLTQIASNATFRIGGTGSMLFGADVNNEGILINDGTITVP